MNGKVQVFDPAMCCSTGVCGPSVDPVLPRFAADLDWLKTQGLEVERFNLSQQPAAFAESAVVKQALEDQGTECLPLILFQGRIVSTGKYPTRSSLAARVGLPAVVEEAAPAKACCPPAPGASAGASTSPSTAGKCC